jgi:hypothetical protein
VAVLADRHAGRRLGSGRLNPLQLAKDAYMSSTSFIDNNYRKKWEDNLRLFQSRHPQGSKYNSDFYKHRSRLFRPKTRSVVRKNEAAAAIAFFANPDVVTCEPENKSDPRQQAGAATMQELLNYRLDKSIPWFQTVVGGVQDAQIYGVVCSYQYWKYKPGKYDKPCVELLPPENLRFDPNADWTDVVGTTPILQRLVPMYVADLRSIRQATVEFDTTRQEREDRRQDAKTEHGQPIKDFEVVWAMENFLRWEDQEWVYWTLGISHMLSEPKPLADEYFHGERPFAMGVGMIEAHKVMPDSLVNVGSDLQREANELVNQRLDNVKLVLNKRWLVRSGRNVDVDSLNRNVPGGVTLSDDISEDSVREVNWPDVTASAYMEQDRVNADMDDLVGNFQGSSVMTNRKLNETVGGMAMLGQTASQLTEYLLRTITETWLEKVIRQLVKLEQYYETDEVILSIAGERAQIQKYGYQVSDDLLNQELTIRVNVGMNATDPMMRLQKFLASVTAYTQVAMNAPPNLNVPEVGKEIFGMAGYRDGSRFLSDVDPRLQQAQQAIQKLQQLIEGQQVQLEDKDQDRQVEMAKVQLDAQRLQIEAQTASADAQLKQAQTMKTMAEAQGDGGMQQKWAEVEMKQQEKLALLELKRAELESKQALERDKLVAELMLEREKAMAQLEVEREKMAAQTDLKSREIEANADIGMRKTRAELGLKAYSAEEKTKLDREEAEHKRKAEEEKTAEKAQKQTSDKKLDKLIEQMGAVAQELAKPKKITLETKAGKVTGATVR